MPDWESSSIWGAHQNIICLKKNKKKGVAKVGDLFFNISYEMPAILRKVFFMLVAFLHNDSSNFMSLNQIFNKELLAAQN